MDEIFIFLWASCICVWYIWNTVWYVLHRKKKTFSVVFFLFRDPDDFFPSLFSSFAPTCFYFIISGFKQKKNYNENIRQSLSGIQRAFKSTIIHVNNNHNLWWNLHTSRAVSHVVDKMSRTLRTASASHTVSSHKLRQQISAIIEIYRD